MFRKIIQKPDFEHLIVNVSYWKIEFSKKKNCTWREIGFDQEGIPILAMPIGYKDGLWTATDLTLADYKQFHPKTISADEFEKDWKEFEKKNKIEHKVNHKRKIFKNISLLFLFVGIILFMNGLYVKLFIRPMLGINISTMQPVMIDGTLRLILGLGSTIVGLYRLFFFKEVFQDEINIEREIEEEKKKQIRRNQGFKK